MADAGNGPVASGSWQPDPTGRYRLRWQLSTGEWTDHVYSDDGEPGRDPYGALSVPRPPTPDDDTLSEGRRLTVEAQEPRRRGSKTLLIVLGTIVALIIVVGAVGALAGLLLDAPSQERSQLVVSVSEEPSRATESPSPTRAQNEETPEERSRPVVSEPEEPEPEILGDCRDGMRLNIGEGCLYTGGGRHRAEVVLSVSRDGLICREGGPAQHQDLGVTVDHLRICRGGAFERDDAFESPIVVERSRDGRLISWTVYSSPAALQASRTPESPSPTEEVATAATPEPAAAPATTPAGPELGATNLECSGEQTSLSHYSYKVTGEIHAYQDVENVHVGFGEDSFMEIGIGSWIYLGHPGTSVELGSMSAGESRSFELSFGSAFELDECGINVVGTVRS